MVQKQLKALSWRLWPQRLAQQHLAEDRGAEVEEAIVPVFLSQTADCVDVGANRGRYTILMSLAARRVHAFDPNPKCIANLRELALPNASIYPCALSSDPGTSEYFVPVQDGTQMSIWGTLERSIFATHHEVETIKVEKTTLDSLSDRAISFVKIDVEGHEIEVLQGGKQLIAQQKPVFMVEAEERHRPGAVAQINDFFSAYGYECFFILDRQILPFASFDNDYQNPAALQVDAPRSQMRYVNNFVFIPTTADISSLLDQMQVRLSEAIAAA